MPAPEKFPDWATDGTNVVEVPSGKVTTGWVPGEQPPAGWFNWWKNLVGLWTRWLDSEVNTLNTHIAALQSEHDTLESEHDALAADAALKSAQNIFIRPQEIDLPLDWMDTALLTTAVRPGDFTNAGAVQNLWKTILGFPCDGNAAAGYFVGRSTKRFALTYNARWNVNQQKWNQQDSALKSYALVCSDDTFIVSMQNAGAGPWTNWPSNNGGDLLVGGKATANTDLQANRDSYAANNFRYTTPPTRQTFVPLFSGFGNAVLAGGSGNQSGSAAYKLRFIAVGSPAGEHVFPIRLPQGATLTAVHVLAKLAANAIMKIELNQRTNHNFEQAGGAGGNLLDQTSLSTGTWGLSGLAVIACNTPTSALSIPIDNRADDSASGGSEYLLSVIAGTVNDEIHAIRVTWTDPGPRTH